jgi:TRAP-type uncharacterized transport system substrate-binding protein
MSYLTYAEILKKVLEPLDLEDEVFIGSAEMIGYCNDAIKRCESKIHTIYEDYFLTDDYLTLTQGQQDVDLPADLYANKIRSIIWTEGVGSRQIYEILRIKDIHKFIRIEQDNANNLNSDYRYWIKNSSPSQTGRKIMLVPAARETTSAKVKIYYLRRANKVTQDTDLVDIPEFYSVIVAYMRYMSYRKEGHPNAEEAKLELLDEEKNMVETLTEMVPDGENEIPIPADPYNGAIDPGAGYME